MRQPRADWDSVWKDALEEFLGPFLELLFPEVARAIDWRHPAVFLEQELRPILRGFPRGLRVDKLARVRGANGRPRWVFLHMEVQGRSEPGFAARMFRYWCRLTERHGPDVLSLAILADGDAGWRPSVHVGGMPPCAVRFEFPACKLLDLAPSLDRTLSTNPAALVVAAHLAALRTPGHGMAGDRLASKLALARRLRRSGFDADRVARLFAFLDWLLVLPEPRTVEFWEQLGKDDPEDAMKLMSHIEWVGFQKGEAKGRTEGLSEGRTEGRTEGRSEGQVIAARALVIEVAKARFGRVPLAARRRIRSIGDEPTLRALARCAAIAPSRAQFESAVARA